MHFLEADSYIRAKKGVTYDYPFDEEVRVYRVGEKIFALTKEEDPLRINLKCDPLYALELRTLYDAITPGYHMNKKHWNTVVSGADVEDTLIKELIDHSYDLVVSKLTKKQKELLGFV